MTTTKKEDLKRLIMEKLYQKAQNGDQETLDHFTKVWGLKVYTNEEVKIINFLLRRQHNMESEEIKSEEIKSEIVTVKEDRIVELPSLDGVLHPARINWLEDIGDGHFRAGLTYGGHYPYDGGSTEWILKLDSELGFKPLFCSLYWKEVS